MDQPDKRLRQLFHAAVSAAHPRQALESFLPKNRRHPLVVVGAGKAAASMAAALEDHWLGPVRGTVITRYGHVDQGKPTRQIKVLQAGHPIPDQNSLNATTEILDLVRPLGAEDQVFCLLSGGASALLCQPKPGVSLNELIDLSQALLQSGAAISQINQVRRDLSLIKGGGLASAIAPAQLTTFAISDIPGDDPTAIGSGPTLPPVASNVTSMEILHAYQIKVSSELSQALQTLHVHKVPDYPFHLIATAQSMLQAVSREAASYGWQPIILSDRIEGEAREVARAHVQEIHRYLRSQKHRNQPLLLLSGGETSVTVRGTGRGGRNMEFLLSLAIELDPNQGFYAMAADTDGIDGTQIHAGALLTPQCMTKAQSQGLNPLSLLNNNDAARFFAATGQLLETGPTGTNVNDLRAILIPPDTALR